MIWLLLSFCLIGIPRGVQADEPSPSQAEFFEKHVRPLLANRCYSCHGPQKQESGLRLDSRDAILRGGDSGSAAVPGKSAESLLVEAVRRTGDFKMPPKKPLAANEVNAIARWVDAGLPWPNSKSPSGNDLGTKPHWAFQPVVRAEPPKVGNAGWPRTEIDRFVLANLEGEGLQPAPDADPVMLIRRATFDLLGLPPTPEEVSAFEAAFQKDATAAWTDLINRLLDSPRYGERQARHWLDVARYADNKGYVFFEQKNFPWAWTYRDWVINSFNNDMPYDRFAMLQIAADQMDAGPASLAAMGFLTLGPRFSNNTHDILDDRIDVVTRGLLGLTVTCARCHDHKFDPVPQKDYYSLYGVFRSSREPTLRPLLTEEPNSDEYREFAKGLKDRIDKLESFVAKQRQAMMQGSRDRAAEYLLAAHKKRNHPTTENFMLLTDKGAIIPAMLHRWEVYLKRARQRKDPVWSTWFRYSDTAEFEPKLFMQVGDNTNPLVVESFSQTPPKSMDDVAAIYGKLLGKIDTDWQELLKQDPKADRLQDDSAEALRQALYGPGSPPMVPRELGWGFLDLLPDRPTQGEFKKLIGEVEKFSTSGKGAPPRAMVLVDSQTKYDPVVFLRGNPNREGSSVPRQFLSMLSSPERTPFQTGSGRLDLAKAIVDPKNPLTARVLVNRIWQQHFGTGLVDTASDFGRQGSSPSHPQLLDWLASQFIADGWSIKRLHRRIMASAVYQQSSVPEPTLRGQAMRTDSANRLLWKFPRRRLAFEAIRDAHLTVAGALDSRIGGAPSNLLSGYQPRRTIYSFVNRMDLPGLMRTFDFPEPAATSPGRDSTTVPQQALFFLNHNFVSETARRLLNRNDVKSLKDPSERLDRIHRILFGRSPSDDELALAGQFLNPGTEEPAKSTAWKYGYGGVDEQTQRVSKFGELSHFTGVRWQAGPALPDGKLGWVFHDRTGGHPASSPDRCFVLRWTAPVTGEFEVTGKLTHRPEPGNGVRGRIVSSQHGILGEWKVDQSAIDTLIKKVAVESGETVDFVVDWQGHITHDEFEWPVVIRSVSGDMSWDSAKDFAGPPTTSWADYVHALLMTNEFVFVE